MPVFLPCVNARAQAVPGSKSFQLLSRAELCTEKPGAVLRCSSSAEHPRLRMSPSFCRGAESSTSPHLPLQLLGLCRYKSILIPLKCTGKIV